ncbi:MAG: CoA pyrophosphatase [Deltaproteobacteria bacterium]|nr:CoA pyrophosphatase [Deltaproteobacteria bacterium]
MNPDKILSDKETFKVYLQNLFSSRDRRIIPTDKLRPSAVLIPLCYKDGDPTVILTKRSMSVEYHKGEISFPGGGVEVDDESIETTALREAKEEIGLHPDAVEVLGLLDDHITLLGFHITPVVGMVPYPYKFEINSESQALLWLPLKYTLKDNIWMAQRTSWDKWSVNIYYLKTEAGVVWGATGRILKHFVDLIAGKTISYGPLSQEARQWVDDVMSAQDMYSRES